MLPNLSVIFVIFAVLLLAIVLDRVLFKPLLRVMRERETAVKSAIELAESAAAKAQAATAQFDANLGAARADIYKQMDERRKAADTYRGELMAKTRSDVDAQLADARATLQAQTDQARATLDREAEQLGRDIATKVLGRPS
ncbi:MAG: ATP synthase F0 subunit B [Acidobacteria bacterium]|nr:ATP synthase F0 subunit B [Acidobacteriota bacterium]